MPDIEILGWGYGEKDPNYEGLGQIGRRGKYEAGRSPVNGGTTGMMPVGEFLYVKWRVKHSGEIREDRVDLRKRLPSDMDHHDIYMYVTETQLYVLVFPPITRKARISGDKDTVISGGARPRVPKGKTILEMPEIERYLVYPVSIKH